MPLTERPIVYYVATSIDGFICGPEEDISGFAAEGPGVDRYLADLQQFDTVLMGRRTYEFGYRFGLEPGQPAYPHMQHYIFSRGLHFERPHERVRVQPLDIGIVRELKQAEGGSIYLCGGSIFATWLLEHELIDTVRLKLNPFIQGQGTPLFGPTANNYQLELLATDRYPEGMQIITYGVRY